MSEGKVLKSGVASTFICGSLSTLTLVVNNIVAKKDISVGTLLKLISLNRTVKEMGERWIWECNEFLEQIRESRAVEGQDRLELVRSMQKALLAINHSILGWVQYVNNPDIMSMFDREELHEISEALNKFAEAFIEHDIEVTRKGLGKSPSELKREEGRQPFYV